MPLTHAVETGSRNRHHRPKLDARFWRQFFVPMHDLTLEVVHQHKKLALESGVEFMATVSGGCVKG